MISSASFYLDQFEDDHKPFRCVICCLLRYLLIGEIQSLSLLVGFERKRPHDFATKGK